MTNLPNNWVPRHYQRNLWDYLERGGKRAIEIAHRRWGKDDVALHRTAVAMVERTGSYWHCLPEYEQARKAIWNAVNPHTGIRRIDEAFPPEIRTSKDEQQMFIRLVNGSTWQVIGSDRYNSLVGAGVAGVVFSEWALANPQSWAYIRPMIEENDGWALFITTPRGKNHAKKMLDMAWDNPNWFTEISTVIDTGALSSEQLTEARKEMVALYGAGVGNAQFEQEYLCSFNAAVPGAYYAESIAEARQDGRIGNVSKDPLMPFKAFWDIGVSDATSIWIAQWIDREIRVLDYYEAVGQPLGTHLEWLRASGYSSAKCYLPHDGDKRDVVTAIRFEDHIRQAGFDVETVPNQGRGAELKRIEASRRIFPAIHFNEPKTKAGLDALGWYHEKIDEERQIGLGPEHDWSSHGADAFGLMCVAYEAPNKHYDYEEPDMEWVV